MENDLQWKTYIMRHFSVAITKQEVLRWAFLKMPSGEAADNGTIAPCSPGADEAPTT